MGAQMRMILIWARRFYTNAQALSILTDKINCLQSKLIHGILAGRAGRGGGRRQMRMIIITEITCWHNSCMVDINSKI